MVQSVSPTARALQTCKTRGQARAATIRAMNMSQDKTEPEALTDGEKVPHGVPHPRVIRTFVRRAGRTTAGQARAFETVGPRFLLRHEAAPLDFTAAFGREAPVILEIGFGMGEATAHIAALMPEKNFLCCEVHEPGVGALLKRIDEQGLTHIRILQHDALEVVDTMLPQACLAGIHIFFPDPWHKLRHHKRRLIQPTVVRRLADRLAPGGYIHCATDWEPYAQQMLQVLSAEPALRNTAEGYAPRPDYRPLTKFENRGLRLGHGVWDLVFTRC
jgi:tRNA (guanine-N7-)-methyltransferase